MSSKWLASLIFWVLPLFVSPTFSQEVVSPLPYAGEVDVQTDGPQLLGANQAQSQLVLVPPREAPELTCIKHRGVVVVGMLNRDIPPFFMQDAEGNMVGIDVEIARAMANELGVKIAFNRNAASFDEVIDMVVNRQVDFGISKLSVTLPRAEKVRFSDPYVNLNKAIMLNRVALEKAKTLPTDSLADVLNRPTSQIGVESGSAYVQYAKRLFPNAEIIEFKSWDEDITPKILSGELFAAFRDEWTIRQTMSKVPQSFFRNLSVIIKEEEDPLKIAVPWNSSQLLSWVNSFLESLKIGFDSDALMQRFIEMTTPNSDQNKPGEVK